jgi:hypothetical protein
MHERARASNRHGWTGEVKLKGDLVRRGREKEARTNRWVGGGRGAGGAIIERWEREEGG